MDYQVCTHWNVRDLLRMQGHRQLTPPKEFQRGPKWSSSQKKLYIDSLLRGYPSPAFYLHCTDTEAIIRRDSRMEFGVVDGQQRLNALGEFGTNAWRLLKSPGAGSGASKHFPVEPAEPPGPEWAGLRYDEFPEPLQRRFVSLTLPVIVVKTSDVAVVRDLFIRLQAGTALSAQERRDAWPGEFPEFIKRTAGHPHLAPGLRLFRDLVRGRDDAQRRLAAQMYLLWSHWCATRGDFTDTTSPRIDDLYRTRVRFDPRSTEAQRFRKLIRGFGDALVPRTGKWPEYAVLHGAILLEEADRRGALPLADVLARRPGPARAVSGSLHAFVELIVDSLRASKELNFKSNSERDAYQQFGQWTQAGANRASSIRTRHAFFRNWLWRQIFGADAPTDELPAFPALVHGVPSWSKEDEDELDLDFEIAL